ncbi:MAG: pantoate--beta-alanine ligase [Verrucomicrobiae bacterium]|nr:pantoate--beta-alanine ligase [Verrucomicrobiae bacterium]MCX7722905.1 pantoate--beta-alanine ligase [Verrucomicrobiae bacterium]
MRVIRSVAAMQQLALSWRRRGIYVGFVPTMGYLHEGHLSLIRRATRLVRPRKGKVVVSIYVNPTQFGPNEDFARYPRDLNRDLRMCRAEGVDVVFAPTDRHMYPGLKEGRFSTFVVEEQLSQRMEGASRPGHFRGVTTVVAKLFNIVQPDFAVFGAKDWQQAQVIRRMVADLNFPVRIIVAPTVREPDGLAMSSRNTYLGPAERAAATVLFRAIQRARAAVRARPVSAVKLKRDLEQFIRAEPLAKLDYIEFFDSTTLQPVETVTRGTHIALAVFIGRTRLIDNARL